MKNFLHHRKPTIQGFSLVEILVYIAVLVFVTMAGILTYLSLSTTLVRYETERAVSHAAQVTLERIVRDIRGATSITAAQSSFGTSSPPSLTLVASGTTTKFSLVGGNVMLTQNGVDIGPLTSEDITVDQLYFMRYTGVTTELVRVVLTLSASNKAASTTRTFYGSGVLRGSYE